MTAITGATAVTLATEVVAVFVVVFVGVVVVILIVVEVVVVLIVTWFSAAQLFPNANKFCAQIISPVAFYKRLNKNNFFLTNTIKIILPLNHQYKLS
jgi:hypothetical protein